MRSYIDHQKEYYYEKPEDMVVDGCIYRGPYFLGDDHGTYHGDGTHGRGVGKDPEFLFNWDLPIERDMYVVRKCYNWIDQSDEVFVWLDAKDAFGTITEIGYAKAKNKRIFVAVDKEMENTSFIADIWFALTSADEVVFVENHLIAWNIFVGKDKKENYEEATIEQVQYALKLALSQNYLPDSKSFSNFTKAEIGGVIAYFKDGKKKFKDLIDKYLRKMTEEEITWFEERDYKYKAKDVVEIMKERFKNHDGFKFSIRKHADIVKKLKAKEKKEWTEVTYNERYDSESVRYNNLWLHVLEEELMEEIEESLN